MCSLAVLYSLNVFFLYFHLFTLFCFSLSILRFYPRLKREQSINLVWNISFPLQGPAARYLQNIELQQEVDKTARTVEQQERQIEALESQVGEINPARLTKSKVGLILINWKFLDTFHLDF